MKLPFMGDLLKKKKKERESQVTLSNLITRCNTSGENPLIYLGEQQDQPRRPGGSTERLERAVVKDIHAIVGVLLRT